MTKKIHKAHKIKIYPNKGQANLLQRTFGSVRFYWNFLLDQKKRNYQKKKENPSYVEDKTTYADLKKQDEYVWLKEIEAQALSQATMDLNRAYRNTFKSGFGFPRFKSKRHSRKSYRTAMGIKTNDRYFRVAKVGWMKMAERIRFKGRVMNVTISQSSTGDYFASFIVEVDKDPLPKSKQTIGVDLGISHFCVTSAGEKINNPNFFRSFEKRLAKENRILSRRRRLAIKDGRKLSQAKNYQKQRLKVAKIHEKISNLRKDFLHKLSSIITDENQVICVEDLHVKGMVRNRKLAKSISDVSWSEFVRQLEYKSKWKGRTLIKVDRFFPSSQLCSDCGHRDGRKALNIREWTCSKCGTHHDRDINASINIRTEGLSGIA